MPKVFRKATLESEILKILGNSLRDLKDESIPKMLVSFTRVLLSKDKRYAKIYISVFDKDHDQERAEEIFEKVVKHAGFFRTLIAKNVRLYSAPELVFILDRGIEESVKIQGIIDSLKKEDSQEKTENEV